MNNFEDTLVNPNISAGNYQAVNANSRKVYVESTKPSGSNDSYKSTNKISAASIFTFGLFLVLTTTFLFVISAF